VKSGFIQVNKPEPQNVLLTGPENKLNKIDHLQTEVLKRENVDLPFSVEVPVLNPEPELMTVDPRQLPVDINVEMIGERSIGNVPIRVKNQPDDLQIQFIPNTVVLRITGGNNQIQSLTSSDFYVYFDYLAQWFPNKNFYTVKVTSPEEVLDVIRMVPEQIEVVVIKKGNK
jgi:YbbR domain-containing protein